MDLRRVLALVVWALPAMVWAGPLCEEYFAADAVMVARVTAVREIDGETFSVSGKVTEVALRVEEPFRGAARGDVLVYTGVMPGQGGGDRVAFEIGKRYLVYATRRGARLVTTTLTRTRLVGEAAEDLAFARLPPARRAPPTVRVEVLLGRDTIENDPGQPMPGIRVRVGAAEQTTDAGGQAILTVTPGAVVVEAFAPAGYSIGARREVRLEEGQCLWAPFDLDHDNALEGRIGGGPAEVRLAARELERFVVTDGRGKFRFGGLRPGEYVLAVAGDGLTVDRRPFPIVARVPVTIAAGAGVVVRDLGAPVLQPRQVTGVVLLPGDRPVAGIAVNWGLPGDDARSYAVETDAKGRFGFTAYEGIAYRVGVTGFDRRRISQQDHASAQVPAKGPVPRLTLRIERYDR